MMLLNKIKVDFDFEDNRGRLTQIVHDGYKQINVLINNANITRGGHFHKVSTECFYVVRGSVNIKVKKDDIEEEYTFNENDLFEIPPYVIHSMYFPEECILVALYDRPIESEDGTKDIYAVN